LALAVKIFVLFANDVRPIIDLFEVVQCRCKGDAALPSR
jgi:hypothetical protein